MKLLTTSAGARLVVALLAAAAAVSPGAAQSWRQQLPAARGLIVGQVIDAVTGRPLRDAIVSISGASQASRDGGLPAPRILTSADGFFVFRDLARGSFIIRAVKQGYTEGGSGRRLPGGPLQPIALADGERIGSVPVRMWRPGALTGTVVDEADEPLVNIRVRALRRTVGSGRPRFLGDATATTDDRGMYRLGGLLPGEYIVVVPARHVILPQALAREVQAGRLHPPREFASELSVDATAIQLRDSVVAIDGSPVPPIAGNDRMFIYPPTFHPSTLTIGLTVPLTVAAGEERSGIDLQLHPVPTLRVSGFVVGPDGPAGGVPVRLWPDGFDDIGLEQDATTAVANANGAFVFPAVPTGHYSLRASRVHRPDDTNSSPLQPALWADVPIAVGTDDLDGVVVTLNDALRIRGRIELDSTSRGARPARLEQIPMLAEAVDGFPVLPTAPPSTSGSTGDFTIGPLSPGRYFIRPAASPAGWRLKSAIYDGRDVSETPLDLRADVNGLVVTLTDQLNGIRGVVRLPQGQPDAGAIVIAFPTDIHAWTDFGPSPRRVRSAWTGGSGEYSIAGVPPGEYFLVALPDAMSADWRDAATLRALSRVATSVSIRDGEQKTQDLRTRSTW